MVNCLNYFLRDKGNVKIKPKCVSIFFNKKMQEPLHYARFAEKL